MNLDDKIWNNGMDYFIEESDWQDGAKTELPKGTELCKYSDSTHLTTGFYFASATGYWTAFK